MANRVASSFTVLKQDEEFWPHLYEHDMDRLREFAGKCGATEDKDIQDVGALVTRVLDWIVAESRAAANAVRLCAVRYDTDDVSVISADMGIEGRGDNVLGALQDCVNQMAEVAYQLSESGEEDTIGYKDTILDWIEEFPGE